MSSINTVTITGSLAEAPQIRYSSNGVAHTTIRLWHFRTVERPGQTTGTIDLFTVHCTGDLAEHVALSLTKTMSIHVTGHLEQWSWASDDGSFSSVEIVADEVSPSLRHGVAEVRPRTPDE